MSEAPSKVKLKFSDGTSVDCSVERSPEKDRKRRGGTIEYYTARPVKDISPGLTYQLEVGVWPAKTGISVDLGLTEDASSLMRGMQPKELA